MDECHNKDFKYFQDEFNRCACNHIMRAAKYINADGSIDEDVYLKAKTESHRWFRRANSIEFYRKGK